MRTTSPHKVAAFVLMVCANNSAQAVDNPFVFAYPGVNWVKAASIDVDLDGDGKKDQFVMGVSGDRLIVAIKLAGHAKPAKLEFLTKEFHCSPATFTDACGMPLLKLEIVPIKKQDIAEMKMIYDLKSTNIFIQNGKAEGVSVPIGEEDPYLFFWNAKTRSLDWLRE